MLDILTFFNVFSAVFSSELLSINSAISVYAYKFSIVKFVFELVLFFESQLLKNIILFIENIVYLFFSANDIMLFSKVFLFNNFSYVFRQRKTNIIIRIIIMIIWIILFIKIFLFFSFIFFCSSYIYFIIQLLYKLHLNFLKSFNKVL